MFGKPEPGSKYFELHQKLQLNTSRFAAYKANKVTGLLKNLPASKFDENAVKVLKNFNRYQSAEYNAVVARSRTAKQFTDFEREAHLYPMLEWLPTSSVTPRDEHVRLVGTILPINDPFWNTNQPGNLWGCKCDWKTTDAPASHVLPNSVTPSPGLDGNPADTGEIFTDKHPYIKLAKNKDEVESFVNDEHIKTLTPIVNAFRESIPKHDGITFKSENFASGEMTLIRRSVKTIIHKNNTNYQIYLHLLNIEKNAKEWKYLGWSEVDAIKHKEADFFFYYEAKIGDEIKYVNVLVHNQKKTEIPYAIFHTIDEENMHKGVIPKDLYKHIKKRF